MGLIGLRTGATHLDLMNYKIGKFKLKNLPVEGATFNLDWSKSPDSTNRFPARVGLVKINYYDSGLNAGADNNEEACGYATHTFRVPKSDWHPNRDLRTGNWQNNTATYQAGL